MDAMKLDQLKRLEAQQWDEYHRLKELADSAAHIWSQTRQEVKQLEREIEVNRLVEERLAESRIPTMEPR